jgi:MFS family permease
MTKWFERRRGQAAAALSIAVGLETLFPAFALALIDAFGWRTAFSYMALLTFAALLVVIALLRNSPEAEGIRGDHDPDAKGGEQAPVGGCSVREALRFPVFWCCIIAGALAALFWTGINLYAVSVFGECGLTAQVCFHH